MTEKNFSGNGDSFGKGDIRGGRGAGGGKQHIPLPAAPSSRC